MIDKLQLRRLIREVIAETLSEIRSDANFCQSQDSESSSRSPQAADSEEIKLENGVLTEKAILQYAKKGVKRIHLTRSVVITPLARDKAKGLQILLEKERYVNR